MLRNSLRLKSKGKKKKKKKKKKNPTNSQWKLYRIETKPHDNLTQPPPPQPETFCALEGSVYLTVG